MQRILIGLLAGLLFGLGLVISGMVNPAKVQNFFDIAGTFDPSLAFVMIGAIAVAFPAFRMVGLLPRPYRGEEFRVPTNRRLDARLMAGSALFGIGWGLAGLCPGPAITSLALAGGIEVPLFVAFMLSGMAVARLLLLRGINFQFARSTS